MAVTAVHAASPFLRAAWTAGFSAALQQIDIHDPAMAGAGISSRGDDFRTGAGQGAMHQDLFRHGQKRPPPDGHALGVKALEGAVAVQHDHDAVHAHRPAMVAQLPAGGDLDRGADRVQGDGMGGAQRLNGGDAGDDPAAQRQGQPFGDAQGLAKVASMMTGSYIGGGVNFAAMASDRKSVV